MKYQTGTIGELENIAKDDIVRFVCYGCGGSLKTALEQMKMDPHKCYFVDQDKTNIVLDNRKGVKELFQCHRLEDAISEISNAKCFNWIFLITSVYWLQIKEKLEKIEAIKENVLYAWPMIRIQTMIQENELYKERLIYPSLKFYRKWLKFNDYTSEKIEEMINEKKLYLMEQSGGVYKHFVLPKLVFFLTSRCTLRCKECTALIPEFKNQIDIPLDRVISDMKRVLDAIDECIILQLAGGESLLYPNIAEVLNFLVRQEKVKGISFVTNATITPNEQVLQILRNPKIFIQVSDYGMLDKLYNTVQLFEKNGIHFEILSNLKWVKVGDTHYRGKAREQLQFEYLRCGNGEGCKMVEQGKIHICDRSARMHMLNHFESNHDYCSIECNREELRKRIMDIYLSDFAEACNYCDYANVDVLEIEAGEQLGKQIIKSKYTISRRDR